LATILKKEKSPDDVNIGHQIKLGLRAKIIWLIVILVAIIMFFGISDHPSG